MPEQTEAAPAAQVSASSTARKDEEAQRLLELKRKRFEEAGRFPMRRVVATGVIAFVLLFAAVAGYQQFQKSKQVGGVVIMENPKYPSENVQMLRYKDSESPAKQTADGISFPVAALTKNYIIGITYKRKKPMPWGYQQAAGGDILPLLAYIAPSGRLVVATSFCEPCRSRTFHFEGNQLVCDTCYTRWDLNTLLGVSGGCTLYPPEEVKAEVRGDQIFMPKADLEAWIPRGYDNQVPSGPKMTTTTAKSGT